MIIRYKYAKFNANEQYVFRKKTASKNTFETVLFFVRQKFNNSPLPLQTKCNLNPKNHPTVLLPTSAIFITLDTFVFAYSVVESTKVIPVYSPKYTNFKIVIE